MITHAKPADRVRSMMRKAMRLVDREIDRNPAFRTRREWIHLMRYNGLMIRLERIESR